MYLQILMIVLYCISAFTCGEIQSTGTCQQNCSEIYRASKIRDRIDNQHPAYQYAVYKNFNVEMFL